MPEKLSAWTIRKKFPNPSQASCPTGVYCVGGALSKYLAGEETPPIAEVPFPTIDELTYILRGVNPDLTPGEAGDFADEIIQENDLGNFEAAWKSLQAALQKGN